MRARWLLGGLVVLAACNPDPPNYDGYVMEDFFSLDGTRLWEFVTSPAEATDYKIIAVLEETTELTDEGRTEIHTITWTRECLPGADETCVDEELVRSYRISSNQSSGTLIHGYETLEDGVVSFDPPVRLTPDRMRPLESVETETGGKTWTSTFEAIGECPVQNGTSWEGCARLWVDDGGVGEFPAGKWWVITGWNAVAFSLGAVAEGSFDPSEEQPRWELVYQEYAD